MLRLLACGAIALTLGGVSDAAHAQSAAQWSQLVDYVGRLAKRVIDQDRKIEVLRAENEQQRQTINMTIAALDQERCRIGRLSSTVKGFAVQPPTVPAYPTWVENVACSDLKSPVPPFPVSLPAPTLP